MRAALGVLLVLTGSAGADVMPPPPSVNLLTAVPSTVAVSSTVDNVRILPGHLVDGKLDTAWNSRTNQLVGAWIGFRVPADAHVDLIKLTVGFTKKDAKLGDLFTMNPRIKRVRVLRDGKSVIEKALDPELRTLQEIPINGVGGDYKIEVLEIVAGSKKTWREISVSELQVWGTPGATAGKKLKPIVRVGSFDPPATLTKADCVKAMYPTAKGNRIGPDKDDDSITGFEAVALGGDIDICRIDHAATGDTSTTVELASVKRTPRLAVIQRLSTFSTSKEDDPANYAGKETTLSLAPFPLTRTETGLLVDAGEHSWGPMYDAGTTSSTLYRVSTSAISDVMSFKSAWSSGEASDADRCTLLPPALGTSLPSLELECEKTEGRYHGEDPRGNGDFTEQRTVRYLWKGTAYEKK